MEHWKTKPDIVTLGKGFGNGFPVTAMVAREEIKESFERISASTSYGGNPMACAAALASIQVIESPTEPQAEPVQLQNPWAVAAAGAPTGAAAPSPVPFNPDPESEYWPTPNGGRELP
jgi:hypothetical protein